ncbi:hypothetical protein BSK56_13875 [Paenibacillus borealis]|uniref:Uncharacterized protein n=2 Tax=Paenibacillus TaxID=44249 RepID=A0ABX3HDA6_PAEBO|nr:hypothetical protein BSK56_13875 [Paenibacillus borealis]
MQMIGSLKLGVAVITAKGINFNDLYYTNAKIIQLGWFERVIIEGEWRIPILFDPIDVSEIYILHPYQVITASAISLSDQKIDPEIEKKYFETVQSLKSRLQLYRKE